MPADSDIIPWAATALILSSGVIWIWWARRGLDRAHKVHCRVCGYLGHPRLADRGARGPVPTCPDCGGEQLIPVRPR